MSDDCQLDMEISQRVSKGGQAFYSLRSKVWNWNGITLRPKLLVCHAIITLTLLYGSETWTTHVRHFRKIECFKQRGLRQLMGIKWQDKISNVETQKRACAIPAEVAIRNNRLRWIGHVCRIPTLLSALSKDIGSPPHSTGRSGGVNYLTGKSRLS